MSAINLFFFSSAKRFHLKLTYSLALLTVNQSNFAMIKEILFFLNFFILRLLEIWLTCFSRTFVCRFHNELQKKKKEKKAFQ